MTTIYLSSTYEDLKDYRSAVFDALRKCGYEVIAMEDYVARDDRPLPTCLEDVGNADFYVGLFAFRYGYVPPVDHGNPERLSITELELNCAAENKTTTCLNFLLEENAPWSNRYNDAWTDEVENCRRIRTLRERLRRDWMTDSFTTPHELASLVQAAVTRKLAELQPEEVTKAPPETAITWHIEKQGSPYPGLLHFTRDYASVFFGRESDTVALLDRLGLPEGRFIIVSGDSGTGKSSLVDAGLLPRLEPKGQNANATFCCVRMLPSQGSDPYDALLRALHGEAQKAGLDPFKTAKELVEQRRTLESVIANIVSRGIGQKRLLLFLDQMEELFASREMAEAVNNFLGQLYSATQAGHLGVVATIRSDLLQHCHQHPDMLAVLRGRGYYPLGHLAPHALRDLIVKPAHCAGLAVSENLANALVQDAGAEPGSLPLLAFTLNRLFERRENDTLSESVYQEWGGKELGGIRGAIAEHAHAVEDELDAQLSTKKFDLRTSLDRVFPGLVRVDLEGLPTRRRALVKDFSATDRIIVDALVKARLLVTERGGDESTVSVAHERLFEAWPTLERWVDKHQEGLRTLRQAELDADEWRRREFGLPHIWHPKRLQNLQELLRGSFSERTNPALEEFAQPQTRLLRLLDSRDLNHEERRMVGRYLEALGDPRRGTGLTAEGVPDIDWVDIPGGPVKLEDAAGKHKVQAFRISRFPITNLQYQAFVQATDGYASSNWWHNMPEDANKEPMPSNWPEPLCPRENVSWYEAVAFCRWLSEQLHTLIDLPTEFEWQQAATGDDPERIYPWGPEWDKSVCNSTESGFNRTTIVGLYAHGTWPGGPLDMAGNVWEWCLNKYDKVKVGSVDDSGDHRVLRGGSWLLGPVSLRSAYRRRFNPGNRNLNVGFRVVCRPSS